MDQTEAKEVILQTRTDAFILYVVKIKIRPIIGHERPEGE
jgi:hypothetical protein